ncbi:unnamed protein product [Amoebophrya sp. A120]|nr:unnamed protein product [Amoebophrya sp. A120]|eukprot:GSA120T00012709001.1
MSAKNMPFVPWTSVLTAFVLAYATVVLPWDRLLTDLLLADHDRTTGRITIKSEDHGSTLRAASYDAVVVLGTSLEYDENLDAVLPTPELVERTLAGAQQAAKTKTERLVFSGGPAYKGYASEAEVMQNTLELIAPLIDGGTTATRSNVEPVANTSKKNDDEKGTASVSSQLLSAVSNLVVLESESVSTLTNAVFTKKLLLDAENKQKPGEQAREKRLLLVTSAYHQLRSRLVFENVFNKNRDGRSARVEIDVADADQALSEICAEIVFAQGNPKISSAPILKTGNKTEVGTKSNFEETLRNRMMHVANRNFVLQRSNSVWYVLYPDREALLRKYMVVRELGGLVKYWLRGNL